MYTFDGSPIARRRRAKGLTQERLSKRAKVHSGHISYIERGKYVPSVLTLANLAAAVDCPPEVLFAECIRTIEPE